MPSPFSVHIEMPVYLQKYLQVQALNDETPLRFPVKHDYNILLFRLLTNRKDTQPVKPGPETIEIILPFNRHKDVYSYNRISRNNRRIFRQAVKDDIFFDFRLFLKRKLMEDMERTKATEFFLSLYGITEEDVQFDSFYRSFSRYLQKRLQIANKFSHLKRQFI